MDRKIFIFIIYVFYIQLTNIEADGEWLQKIISMALANAPFLPRSIKKPIYETPVFQGRRMRTKVSFSTRQVNDRTERKGVKRDERGPWRGGRRGRRQTPPQLTADRTTPWNLGMKPLRFARVVKLTWKFLMIQSHWTLGGDNNKEIVRKEDMRSAVHTLTLWDA